MIAGTSLAHVRSLFTVATGFSLFPSTNHVRSGVVLGGLVRAGIADAVAAALGLPLIVVALGTRRQALNRLDVYRLAAVGAAVCAGGNVTAGGTGSAMGLPVRSSVALPVRRCA